jgi:ESCRT-II complex subunit VPS22
MSTRRGVGLAAFTNHLTTQQSYASHGATLKSTQQSSLQTQLEVFQSLLHNFALEHAATIKSNPQFRAEFARMCNAIGVDPLAGSNVRSGKGGGGGGGKGEGKSLWAKVLGHDVNDFYFSVAVRVVELCQATRGENGGLLGVKECCESVAKGKAIGGGLQVSEDDVQRAVKSLSPLGSGFSVIEIVGKFFIRSVPKELNTDQSTVLEVLQLLGSVTVSLLRVNLNWDTARAVTVLEDLLADSLVWVDFQCAEPDYWSPQGLLDDD